MLCVANIKANHLSMKMLMIKVCLLPFVVLLWGSAAAKSKKGLILLIAAAAALQTPCMRSASSHTSDMSALCTGHGFIVSALAKAAACLHAECACP